jgi:hypothetical protein
VSYLICILHFEALVEHFSTMEHLKSNQVLWATFFFLLAVFSDFMPSILPGVCSMELDINSTHQKASCSVNELWLALFPKTKFPNLLEQNMDDMAEPLIYQCDLKTSQLLS